MQLASVKTFFDDKRNTWLAFFGMLWMLVWATYNTNIFWGFLYLGSPHNVLDVIHGLRSFLPFVALIVSGIFPFKYWKPTKNFFLTPLGLFSLYALCGLLSAAFSNNFFDALYWAVLYGIVLVVLIAATASAESLRALKAIIIINWVIAGFATFALMIFFLAHPEVLNAITFNVLVCVQRPFEHLGDIAAQADFFGVPGTRPTGLARYAGIFSIVVFCSALFTLGKQKIRWWLLFVASVVILLFSKGRTEMAAFIIAAVSITALAKRFTWFIGSVLVVIIITASVIVFFNIPCTSLSALTHTFFDSLVVTPVQQITGKSVFPQKTGFVHQDFQAILHLFSKQAPSGDTTTLAVKSINNIVTLSGRTNGVWKDAVKLFLSSPWVGRGFQADRYFLDGQHAHNTTLHALIQTGLLGTIPLFFGFLLTTIFTWKLLRNPRIQGAERKFLIVVAGVLIFLFLRGITESLAFFSADWLFLAPLIAYIQVLYYSTAK